MSSKNKVARLNKVYSECFSEDEAVDAFIYLTNKNRGKGRGNITTEKHIRDCYNRKTLGALLKRLDLIAYECAE